MYVLSGGGSGGTLVVTGIVGHTCSISNGIKTYTKIFGADKTATFKGLATDTWTITMTDGAQTATRQIYIDADYNLLIAYFSATIAVTYPANSTCVVKDSSSTIVANDTNSGSTAKTFTAIVGDTGAYAVTATSTDGTKTKTASVTITTDGQSESIRLTYEPVLYANGVFDSTITREELITNGSIVYGETTIDCAMNSGTSYAMIAFKEIDLTWLSTISLQIDSLGTYKDGTTIAVVSDVENWDPKKPTTEVTAYATASDSSKAESTLTVDIASIKGTYDVIVGLTTRGGSWKNARTASYSEISIK